MRATGQPGQKGKRNAGIQEKAQGYSRRKRVVVGETSGWSSQQDIELMICTKYLSLCLQKLRTCFCNFYIIEKTLLISIYPQGESSGRKWQRTQILQCEEWTSKWLKVSVKRFHFLHSTTNQHLGERKQKEVGHAVEASFNRQNPSMLGARLSGWFHCSGLSLQCSHPCCLLSKTFTSMEEGLYIHTCYNSSSRRFSLKASPVSLSWASFIPWTTCSALT